MFDPALYDRTSAKVHKRSSWYQCEFVIPESIREKMPVAQLRQCHGRHLIELDREPMQGDEIVYPLSDSCPTFSWKVSAIRCFARRFKSKQPRIVSEIVVNFEKLIEE